MSQNQATPYAGETGWRHCKERAEDSGDNGRDKAGADCQKT